MSAKRSGNTVGRKEALALRLAAGFPIKAAAAGAGVGYSTARLWLADDISLVALVEKLRGEALEQAMSHLTKSTVRAAKVLRELLECKRPSKTASIRLAAAKTCLDAALRLRETVSLEARIAALEAKQRGAKP